MVSGNRHKNIGIVIPVFNDWKALSVLVRKLDEQAKSAELSFHIFIVDDGSPEAPNLGCLSACKGEVSNLLLIRLCSNLGHQRAIAVGLVAASQIEQLEAVVVMDADGEDQPEDVLRLVAAWSEDETHIVVGHRGKRSEGVPFKFFYAVYKFTFRVLTGQRIDFGNFCLVPAGSLRTLTYNPSIWNNLPATITRSRIPRTAISVARGARLAGKSRMGPKDLVMHGLNAISVYADVVLLRVMLGAGILAGLVVLGIAGIIAIRLGTDWAIPGWASYLTASLTIILLQALLISAMALFQLTSLRSVKTFIPALDAMSLVVGAPMPITARINPKPFVKRAT
jgi:polyisoprenyl-phosphate glycosyltransferase